MPQTPPTDLYLGKRDAVIAELGGLTHIYEGKYLIAPYGDANFDCEGAANLKELKAILAEYRRVYPEARVCWL